MSNPANRATNLIDENWDARVAAKYDRRVMELFKPYDALHSLVKLALSRTLPDRAKILVVGAGTGREIIHLGLDNPGWTFVGVDTSQDMLEIAKKNLAKAGLTSRADLIHGTIENAPNFQFDGATSILVFHFLKDGEDGSDSKSQFAFGLSKRVMPGGSLVVADLVGNLGESRFESEFELWETGVLAEAHNPESWAGLKSVREMVQWVSPEREVDIWHKAGFNMEGLLLKWLLLCCWNMTKI